ncbi:uncharacterized protein N7515_009604 [Penicillium bovifimosum]|uniref:HAT C-terminal dimerisation domain-containing protein n=1 Tax=Penicillium bovifimosum TaxID=126998 RepID=A0A9W9KVZ8_9EURO|nr:uncharacterized protein N7515_009604 [Penicillium bovifimosum]KAJ5121643.1 hypothetical protein N7515_009604 [Penicillium bovifimosum]
MKNKRDYAAIAEDVPVPAPRTRTTIWSADTPSAAPISTSPTTPINASMSASNLATDIRPSQSISQGECDVGTIEVKQEDETRSRERSWVWKHFLTTPQSGTWRLGNKERAELKHRSLKQHLEQTHKLYEDGPRLSQDTHKLSQGGHSGCQGSLSSWIARDKQLQFEEAVLDWIVSACQPFTCVEDSLYKDMMRAMGFQGSISSADAMLRRLYLRLDALDSRLRTLMSSASSVALSLDGWTSPDSLSLPMLAINAHWMSPDFEQHRACIDFVQVEPVLSGEYLANIVAPVLEKFHISDKVITITAGSASNNDTLHQCLYQKLSERYDEYLTEPIIEQGTMKFTHISQIRCFSHILNSVVETILRSLRAGSRREVVDLLDDVANRSLKTVNPPPSPIAKFRLLVLWISRYSERIQEWDNPPACTEAINCDDDTHWNSTFVMIARAEECRRQLEETVNDDPEIKALGLTLTPNDWKQLSDIKKVLVPFNECSEYISQSSPSMHMAVRLFTALRSTFSAVMERRGEWQKVSPAITESMSDGLALLEKYHNSVKDNDIYYIAHVLDPRIKTKLIKELPDGEKIIGRIREFLKNAYSPPTQSISTTSPLSWYEYWSPLDNAAGCDIDKYFDTPTIDTGLKIVGQTQIKFIRNWWKDNRSEFSCMAKVAQDHLAIPAAEADLERLFNGEDNGGEDVLGIQYFHTERKDFGAVLRVKDARHWTLQ